MSREPETINLPRNKTLSYPYFEARHWAGRLPVPPQLRGTSIAKQFESGAIGGKRVKETEQFLDTPKGRKDLQLMLRREQGKDIEVDYIAIRTRSRIRVHGAICLDPKFIKAGVPKRLLR